MPTPDPEAARLRRVQAALPLRYLRYRWLRGRWKRRREAAARAYVAERTDGLLMAVDEADIIDFMILHFGVWEPALAAIVARHLRSGDRAVDIGANIGAHTLTMAKAVGAAGKVLAIEPGPQTFLRLRDNVSMNGFAQVEAVNAAASDEAGVLTLYAGPDGTRGRATIAPIDGAARAKEAEVRAAPAAGFWPEEEWRRTRLIKIDVERAEEKVLRGLAPILPILPKDALLILETEPEDLVRRGAHFEDLLAPLLSRGAAAKELHHAADLRAMIWRKRPTVCEATSRGGEARDYLIAQPTVLANVL